MMRGGLTPWVSSMATNLGHRGCRSRPHLVRRPRRVPGRPSADRHPRRFGRHLAVLRPAPVRGDGMGEGCRLGIPACRTARLVLLRPAAGAELVHRQYRCPPRPPLSAKVPCYRLQEVLRDYPELRGIGRVTLLESLRCVKLALWDESRRKLVSFREAGWRPKQFQEKCETVACPELRQNKKNRKTAALWARRLSKIPDQAALRSSRIRISPWRISVPSTFRHSRMKAARPGQPLADTRLPSTWAPVGATSI